MSYTAIGQFLFLLLVANGAPIIASDIFKGLLSCPLDGGKILYDGRRLFGSAKTIRGLLAAAVATGCAAPMVGRSILLGVCLGLYAMAGDLISSFMKRRLGIKNGDSALGLDQSLEALTPAVMLRAPFGFQSAEIVIVVLAFFLLEIGLSRLLYRLHIRDRPL
jgi:CDP-2,3-bis-(O-geranylgeranyl)-sn-glycerol synthase